MIIAGPYSELDVMLSQGAMPVALSDDGSPLRPWLLTAGTADIDTFAITGGPNAESVAATNGDVVIMKGTTYQSYPESIEMNCKVCPVLGIPAGIEEQLALVADALGLDPAVVEVASAAVQAAFDEPRPVWQLTSIAFVNYWGEMHTWTVDSPHSALCERLGLLTLGEPMGPDSTARGELLSLERLDLLNVDSLLVAADDASSAWLEDHQAPMTATDLKARLMPIDRFPYHVRVLTPTPSTSIKSAR